MKLLVPPPIVALVSGLGMWAVASALPTTSIAFPYQFVLGYGLIGLGVLIDLVSVLAFLKANTTVTPLAPEKASSLVTGGLYRFTRNPMYLGLLIILCGLAVLFGSLFNIAVLVAFITYISVFQIMPEEARLSQIFGSDYEAYKRSVRRWI